MRRQIEEAVYFLFTWMQGTFNFEADVHPEEQDLLVSINPESLLLEGARRMDEWNLVEKKIPSFDLVFEMDQNHVKASDAALTEEQRTVLDLIDGQRDVQGIIDESGLVEFEVGKALYGLLTAGFVHRVGRTKASAEPRFRMPAARSLAIAGNWNAWTPAPLQAVGDDIWEAALLLGPGTYYFNLVVDGVEWVVPAGVATISDGMGGLIAVLNVL